MAQSQVTDWTNENEYRMYPLLESSARVSNLGYTLNTNVILDLSLYVPGYSLADNIQLLSIEVSGVAVTFTFTGGNVFFISDVTAITFPYYPTRLSSGSVITIGHGVKNIPSGTHTFPTLYVEPAVVYELSNMWLGVSEITVEPEYLTASAGTPSYIAELPLTTSSPTTFTGDIYLFAGFNFGINIKQNVINLSVIKNYGIPLDCSTKFITDDAKDCGSIISYINGVPPDASGNFSLTGGNDILLIDGNTVDYFVDEIDAAYHIAHPSFTAPVANPYSLFVGLTFMQTDICSPVYTLPLS